MTNKQKGKPKMSEFNLEKPPVDTSRVEVDKPDALPGFLKGLHSRMFTTHAANRVLGQECGRLIWLIVALKPVRALMRLNQTSCCQWPSVKRVLQKCLHSSSTTRRTALKTYRPGETIWPPARVCRFYCSAYKHILEFPAVTWCVAVTCDFCARVRFNTKLSVSETFPFSSWEVGLWRFLCCKQMRHRWKGTRGAGCSCCS